MVIAHLLPACDDDTYACADTPESVYDLQLKLKQTTLRNELLFIADGTHVTAAIILLWFCR